MKAFARATWILFRAHLWRIFRTRRGWIAAGLAALPVLMALAVSTISRYEGKPLPVEALMSFTWFVLIQTIVPIVALVMASSVIAEEIEDRTITYLFTRPIPRAAILFGRWSAAALPLVLLLCGSAELLIRILEPVSEKMEGGSWMPDGLHARILVTVSMGALVYSALFASAGALFKRPMLIGLGYTFVYEGFLGNLPGSSQKSTVIYYLKSFLLARHPGLGGEVSEALFSTPLLEPAAAVRSLALILIGILALGVWRFSRREYVLAA